MEMGEKESQDISKRKGVSTNIKLWLSNPLSEEKKHKLFPVESHSLCNVVSLKLWDILDHIIG